MSLAIYHSVSLSAGLARVAVPTKGSPVNKLGE